MSAIARDDPAPRIQCSRCYQYYPPSAFKVRTFNKALKSGGVSHKTYRMRICNVCQREIDILRKLPPAERLPYAEIGAVIRCPLTPLPTGGFAAYAVDGRWLADGESAIEIVAELYRKARENNPSIQMTREPKQADCTKI